MIVCDAGAVTTRCGIKLLCFTRKFLLVCTRTVVILFDGHTIDTDPYLDLFGSKIHHGATGERGFTSLAGSPLSNSR